MLELINRHWLHNVDFICTEWDLYGVHLVCSNYIYIINITINLMIFDIMAAYSIRVLFVSVIFFISKANDAVPYILRATRCKLPLRVLPLGNNTWSNQAEVFSVIKDLLKNPLGVPIRLIWRTIIAPSGNVIPARHLTLIKPRIYTADISSPLIFYSDLIYGGLLPCGVLFYWRSLSDIRMNDYIPYSRSEMIATAEVYFSV